MRDLIAFTAIALLVPALAGAATFNADPHASELAIKLGAFPEIEISRNGTGHAWVSGSAPNVVLEEETSIWASTAFGPGTALFKGIPLVENFHFASVVNGGATHSQGVPLPNPVGPGSIAGIIGVGGLEGGLWIRGLWELSHDNAGTNYVALSGIGRSAAATTSTYWGISSPPTFEPELRVVMTFGPWVTGTVTITNITTNVVQVTGRNASSQTGIAFSLSPQTTEQQRTFTVGGNFITSYPNNLLDVLHTVTIKGSVDFPTTASGTGTITVVSPMRIHVSNKWAFFYSQWAPPGYVRKKFSFVPEPSTFLLLVAGAVGLAFLGRGRMS